MLVIAGTLARRLKSLREVAKVWSRRNRTPPAIIPNCKFIIQLLDTFEEVRPLSNDKIQVRQMSYERLALELKQRATYWKQRSKFREMREGDNNTAFFHAIRNLEVDGTQITNHNGKVQASTEYFRTIIGVPGNSVWLFDCNGLYQGRPIPDDSLTALFNEHC
jgi:hypothetical protein